MVDVLDRRLRVGKCEQERAVSDGQGVLHFWPGALPDDRCEGPRRDLLRPVASACPCRCEIPVYRLTEYNGPVAPPPY